MRDVYKRQISAFVLATDKHGNLDADYACIEVDEIASVGVLPKIEPDCAPVSYTHLDASVKKLTVNTLFERYMATKNIKERTKKNYIRMWDYRIRNTLGNIRAVSYTHLTVAVNDDLLKTSESNDFVFCMFGVNPTEEKFRFTDKQKEKMISFGDTALILSLIHILVQ